MTRTTAFVIACVRLWTRIYTWRLPPTARDARRDEIESDLWESAYDRQMTQAEILIQIVARFTLGIADDLAWRFAQVSQSGSGLRRMATAAAALCVLLLFTTHSRLTANIPGVPAPPGVLLGRDEVRNPPPPPPPPVAMTEKEVTFQYGRSAYSVAAAGPAPVLSKQVQPIYPPVALAAGLEGQVLVQANITERGHIQDAEVAPAGILGQSAIDAVQQWEFAAAGHGVQRRARLTVRVSFERSR